MTVLTKTITAARNLTKPVGIQNMTVYSQLIEQGFTDEEIRSAHDNLPSSREFSVAVADTPDGDPIVGVTYACGYRSEEESGVGELYKSLRGDDVYRWEMLPDRSDRIGRFANIPSLILSMSPIAGRDAIIWGDDVLEVGGDRRWGSLASGSAAHPDEYEAYDARYSHSLPHTQGLRSERNYRWAKVPELREAAKKLGVKPMPKTKKLIVEAIQAHPDYLMSAETPNRWPGWFHYGKTLVLRADRGVAAAVLNLLYTAGAEGRLALGGGSQVFGSGLAVYDGRDVGPKLRAERDKIALWTKQQEKNLEPVKTVLKERGFRWYFLGKPTTLDTGDGRTAVRYWLNGAGTPQPHGWYTLDELLAEKFVADARMSHAEKVAARNQ